MVLILKQDSWFYSHLGHCSQVGEILRHLAWHLSQVFACYLPLINYIPLSFTDFIPWQSMPFSYRKWTGGGKEMAPLWGNINICPSLHQLQLPCHSHVELSSLNSLKAWGKGQKLHHDIAFLLVLIDKEVTEDRRYGLSTVWVNPSQARVSSMEEVVRKLTACASWESDWPYALVQLHEGTCHVPLPKEGHLGILPQTGAEAIPCRQISQLEVCQLLIAGPKLSTP